jgi:hypothetical protein
MKKTRFCCVLLPLATLVLALGLGGYLVVYRFTVPVQIEAQPVGASALVFGSIQDTVSVPLVVTAYLLHDGQDSVWVSCSGPLPQTGRHVLVRGLIKGGLKIPGKLGGGTLLKHLEESTRWDLPL